jgi:NAD(P)-dependent dehydrogenase (short-subunit alcohol dehydrogenase family)
MKYSILGNILLSHGLVLETTKAWSVPPPPRTSPAPRDSSGDSGTSTPVSPQRRALGRAAVGFAAATLTVGVAPSVPVAQAAETDTKIYSPPRKSLTNKVVLITGGNTGLGLESGKRLAASGATVILTTRSVAKGQQAVREVQEYLNEQGVENSHVQYVTLDLCDLQQVKDFPNTLSSVLSKDQSIDVLMNNAGVMAIPDRQLTKDGYERTFQTNHLGHFVLTAKLASRLANDARIVNVSSEAWQFAPKGIELDNLNGEREYGPWSSYGQSKLANILFAKELQAKADAAGKAWTVTSLHPGAVATDLGRYIVGEEKWNDMKENGMSFRDKLLFVPLSKFTKTVPEGASTQVYLAANPGKGGSYYIDCKAKTLKGAPTDMAKADALWQVSEKLGGVQFQL